MNVKAFKKSLENVSNIDIQLPNGQPIPAHFHITEVGMIDKQFIDCGGTIRNEKKVSLQLWESTDTWHRLSPEKLLKIIGIAEEAVDLGNHEIEVEYQGDTIQKFGLQFDGNNFQLTTKMTDCLAKDNCGIPQQKPKVKLSQLQQKGGCDPNSGCC